MVVKRAFIKPKQGRKRPEHREGNTYIKRQEAKRKRESYTEGAIQSVALDITECPARGELTAYQIPQCGLIEVRLLL